MGFKGIKDSIMRQPPSFNKKKAYQLHEVIGTGSFGKVMKATWTKPTPPGEPPAEPKLVALKVIQKKRVKGNEASVWGEMEVLRGLDHPNIVECALFLTVCFLLKFML